MKLHFILFVALALSISAAAQKDTLKLEVDGTEIIILSDDIDKLNELDLNKMLTQFNEEAQELTQEYKARVDALIAQFENEELTEDEFKSNMELEAERFEIKMEALDDEIEVWGSNYEDHWEDFEEDDSDQWLAWAEEWEDRAEGMDGALPPPPPPPYANHEDHIVFDDNDDWDWQWDNYYKKRKNKQPQTTAQGDIHFGWNNMLDNGYLVTDVPGELRTWQSFVFTLGFAGKTRIGKSHSKLYIRYGLQFNWQHFRLKGNNIIHKEESIDGTVFVPANQPRPEIQNVSYSRYKVVYMDVPLMLMLDLSKKRMDNSLTLGVGGYGGVKINNKRKIFYDDFNNDAVKEKTRNDFYMNQWRYGAMAQIGYGAFKITGKYDLNYFFREDKATPNYQIASVAFGFVF